MTRTRHITARRLASLAAAGVVGAGAAVGVTTALDDGPAMTTTVAAATTAATGSSTATPVASSLTASQIYARDAAGVVELTVTEVESDPWGRQRSSTGTGSGFVIDTKGHIVTNAHVVSGASSITVRFSSGHTAQATVVGTDVSTDLAVLHVSVSASTLHPLTLGSSAAVKVGQPVVAIGSPFGYEGTMTAGIVSALGRSIEAPNGATITGAIQTDAAINPGSSGGPLIDASGNVIGVNAQIESSSNGNVGVGFAIPSSTVRTVVARILAGGL